MGVSEHLIVLLHNLKDNQEATVRTQIEETDCFGIEKGVRQGCILSPTLFKSIVQKLLCKRQSGVNHKKVFELGVER